MRTPLLILLTIAAVASAIAPARAQVKPLGDPKLAFVTAGTNEFAFDTGVLRGKLRAGGKSMGLSSVVHIPTGMTMDHSMGLFSHYRVFTANKRYGSAAWDWPSEAKLLPNGSVEVHWPSAGDRPFELRALYRWSAPNILDLETTVEAKTSLSKLESFLASYFAEGFTNASVCARTNGFPCMMRTGKSGGTWQAYPRDAEAVSIIQDGRWKFPPSPVEWVIQPNLAKPLGARLCPSNDLRALLMAPPQECFAVLTPLEAEPHRSMYLCLFGKDLKPGETTRARARLVIGTNLSGEELHDAYDTYLRQVR